jgi:hypothetical protein
MYQICIKGHINSDWAEWLQNFQIKHKRNGISVLTGQIIDQAALQGLLNQLFDLGIIVLSMKRIEHHHWIFHSFETLTISFL